MSQKRIEEITARCDAAYPGPWVNAFGTRVLADSDAFQIAMMRGWGYLTSGTAAHCKKLPPEEAIAIQERNCEFMAHAREDIPFLLGEVARLEKELADERAALEMTKQSFTDFAEDRQAELWANMSEAERDRAIKFAMGG